MDNDNKKRIAIEAHLSIHRFDRETYIRNIIMFHEAEQENGEKGLIAFHKINNIRITVDTLKDLSDDYLIKIHKYIFPFVCIRQTKGPNRFGIHLN